MQKTSGSIKERGEGDPQDDMEGRKQDNCCALSTERPSQDLNMFINV